MSYISITVPAFYCSSNDFEEAKTFFSSKIGISSNEFDFFSIDPATHSKTEFGVRLHNSNLSLNYLEEILYQRNCMRIYMDKTFESMQGMMSRISVLENEIKEISDSNKER